MSQTYKSKIDTALCAILVAVVALCFMTFVSSIREGDLPAFLRILPVLVIGASLPLWVLSGTRYTLTDSMLLVRSGPFSWKIPVDQITGVIPTCSPLSSPALSLDRLRIDYGRGRSIMISPQDKEQFVRDLERLGVNNPHPPTADHD